MFKPKITKEQRIELEETIKKIIQGTHKETTQALANRFGLSHGYCSSLKSTIAKRINNNINSGHTRPKNKKSGDATHDSIDEIERNILEDMKQKKISAPDAMRQLRELRLLKTTVNNGQEYEKRIIELEPTPADRETLKKLEEEKQKAEDERKFGMRL